MAVIASERGRAPPTAPEQEFSTEGLPRAFLQSLRTLFDILDDRRRGYVHLLEIESRWQGADTRELPRGVLEGLRKVAPASGYLTFERFVVGLRTSLLSAENGAPHARAPQGSRGQASQAKVLPMGPGICKASSGQGRGKLVHEKHHQRLIFAPADEPRTMLEKKPLSLGIRYPHAGSSCSSRSLEKLSSPQEAGCYPGDLERPKSQAPQSPGGLVLERSQSGDAGTDVWTVGRCHSENCTAGGSGRHPRGRGEQRRHTITSGVDYDMLKQMKELEQEKDALLQGLEMMDRGRDWYYQQLQWVQERQRHLAKNKKSTDFGAEGSPSPLGQLLPKLQEVIRCLGDLLAAACAGRVQAVPSPASATPTISPLSGRHQQTIFMLKEQNRLLTKEVTDKSDRITQLEQEKSALIKQLFEARARSHQETSQLDSTFI
ncbi:suppressor APC domain-containing protein 2 isoform X1 [Phascolarctos cinereus]|uniref:Suppressor APC domain-containing protein 2 n=1 Tax=Phascolarctos cinereus TaxID=38626 RepID=A0A6P5JVA3_PHACI|nr:suppressor APC domain-containing protein 2 [Phascolarctos cinereus]